ncbi:hypothetical protein MMIC_P2251 [Mariprofundus micogutta]|uniref:(2Fe-2S) ferredoxin domain-containing protein n=1 Tax=Mariprofundus micogutta TaxID=1921010 RepID=A0A1L8CR17_9PROT|nr:hypothetical protein MMIC_P2251 [Mariprofundus micogutta]
MACKGTVGVCYGPRCSDFGSREMAKELRQNGYEVEDLDCQSLCPHAPAIRVGDRFIHRATLERINEKLQESL